MLCVCYREQSRPQLQLLFLLYVLNCSLTLTLFMEALPAFGEGTLSLIRDNARGAMCDFTHTGGLHLQRWQSQDGIEPNFDPAEIERFLNYSELLAAMCGLEGGSDEQGR